MTSTAFTRILAVLLVALVLLGGVSAVASAQSVERAGGVVTVAAGETVRGDLEAVGGTVLVQGTVDGDLEATAGTVVIAGEVTGDVEAVAGSVTIEGTVGGDVGVAAGSLLVRDGATVGGTLEAAAGAVQVDGTVGGDARLAGEEVVVGPTASVGGNLEYDAERFSIAPGVVAGSVTPNDDMEFAFGPAFGPGDFDVRVPPASFPVGTFAIYGFLVNLLLGAALLTVAPGFARRVTRLGTERTVRSGGAGLLTVVGVPVALVLLVITIVGIPLSLAGVVLFLLVLWIAQVYGALVLGTWLLSLGDRDNRWGALVLGLAVLVVLPFVPFGLGGVARFLIVLVGLGAFVLALRGETGEEGRTPGASDEQPPARSAA